ncbi:NTF2-like protein [Ascobolus immersus RN42]|uniref:NTF2-like protein n=1 Tax=Ascobolus immersus RN42 TaxID=1160509 RepID=A0A3N4HJ13_ASCIM|nr:NTF2-like protein [Ascobolus immersus RN42]
MDSALKRRPGTSGIKKGKGKTKGTSNGSSGASVPNAPPKKASKLVDVKVFGWGSSSSDRDEVVDFIEGMAPCRIRKSKSAGKLLTITVPYHQASLVLALDDISYKDNFLTIKSQTYQHIVKNEVAENTIKEAAPLAKKEETEAILSNVLTSRYNADAKMLDLSHLAEDPTLKSAGFFEQASTRHKMFPAMMIVADKHFKTAAEKKEALHSVTLAYNGLQNLNAVSPLSLSFPAIKNLSLEGNNIKTWNDLGDFRYRLRDLEQLILAGNPVSNDDRYVQECVRIWPKLLRLDNVVIDRAKFSLPPPPPPKAEPPKAAGIVKHVPLTGFPLGIKPGYILDSGVGMKFLTDFFTTYDGNKTKLLADYYDAESTFSVAANTLAPRVEQPGVKIRSNPWVDYYPFSRNLHRTTNQETRRIHKGAAAIGKVWSSLPRTKHDVSDATHWVYDVWPVEGLPDPTNPHNIHGVTGVICTVHGEFEELGPSGVRRSFDRVFTLGPGPTATGVKVVNDMMTVRPFGGCDAWKPTPDDPAAANGGLLGAQMAPVVPVAQVPQDQADLIRQQHLFELYNHTNLTEQYTILCLDQAGGDLQQAYASFEQAKLAGALPAEAFRS